MITRSPCESYLKYLIVHPDGYSNDDIRKIVRAQQLDFIGMPYLQRLRGSCVAPRPFYPEEENHRLSSRFLRRESLEAIFRPDEHMAVATNMLSHPRVKELVETMLISRSEYSWICAALKRIGYLATPESIGRYAQYYFNIDLIDRVELCTLLELRSYFASDSQDPDEQMMGSVHLKISRGDPRRISAGMGSPANAMMLNVIRAGMLPSRLDVGRLVAATRIVSVVQAGEAADRGQPGMGKDYALIAKMMTEILEQTGDPSKTVSEGIADLELMTDTAPTPHIKELSVEHTLDVQPLQERELIDEHPE